MTKDVSLAVMGAGVIGKRHIGHVAREAHLLAVVDPVPEAQAIAEAHGARWYSDFASMLGSVRPDGVIVATPNRLHVENGLACVDAGIPALVEKPIADDVADAVRLVDAAEAAGVPILVGHHRRHNPLIRRAREIVASGELGTIVAAQANCLFLKPDEYFDVAWRRERGAGPVYLNLIHDIDLLRHLCGEVASVQAMESNAVRGFAVEDTAAFLLRFRNGALGTVLASDTVAAPWSWEMTAGENPDFPNTGEFCLLIGGTRGSISVPDLGIWQYPGKPSWFEPITRKSVPADVDNPLAQQVRHFCDVIRGEATPIVTGREGVENLKIIDAVKESARSGLPVDIR